MALYPKIQGPCPYENRLSEILDGDVCRMCRRQVFDLSAMTDGERVAFLRGCGGNVCVSYRIRPALAAAALAVATLAVPSAASAQIDEVIVTAGRMHDTVNVEYVHYDPADRTIPALPVVHEDKPAPPAPDAKPAKPDAPLTAPQPAGP